MLNQKVKRKKGWEKNIYFKNKEKGIKKGRRKYFWKSTRTNWTFNTRLYRWKKRLYCFRRW